MKKLTKNILNKIVNFNKSHSKEFWLLIVTLLVGAFFRLYKIDEYMTFLGDEGRDAIIVRRLWTDFDPILIGPGTSIGNMYLGPHYYYLIAPFLLIFNFSPVGPSIMVALFGVATIYFVWHVVRAWSPVSKNGVHYGALAVSFLYAISPTVIKFSKSSWNPNIMPFFSLLAIYAIWKIFKGGGKLWFVTLTVSLVMVLNSHYLGLLIFPTIGIFWIFGILKQNSEDKIYYKKNTILSVLLFAILMSPLLIFDARHNWQNYDAIKTFFTVRQETVSIKPWNAIPNVGLILQNSTTSLMGVNNNNTGKLMTLLLEIGIVIFSLKFLKSKKITKDEDWAFLLVVLWLGFSLLGLGLYKQHIYDHYFGIFFTTPFILLGLFWQTIEIKKYTYFKIILFGLFLYLSFINLSKSPLKEYPNRQMQRAEDVAELISEKSYGEKMNLAVIAENNYEDGYQYFLEKNRLPVYDIDPLRYDETLADQLFVVCELAKAKCDPVNNPKAGIANFGWSKIDGEWEVSGVIVYKLVHAN